jgi:hypothetical protein
LLQAVLIGELRRHLIDTPRCATLRRDRPATFWTAVSGRWDGEASFFTVVG